MVDSPVPVVVVGTVHMGYRYTRRAVHTEMVALAAHPDQQVVVAAVAGWLNQLPGSGLGCAPWEKRHRNRRLPHNVSRSAAQAPEGSHRVDRNGRVSAT